MRGNNQIKPSIERGDRLLCGGLYTLYQRVSSRGVATPCCVAHTIGTTMTTRHIKTGPTELRIDQSRDHRVKSHNRSTQVALRSSPAWIFTLFVAIAP